MKYAIIGGSTIEALTLPYEILHIETPYGDVDVVEACALDGTQFCFLTRSGFFDRKDACDVNYRANIFALKECGVTNIISISNVGTCDYSHKIGSSCLLCDFIDFTRGRQSSFLREHRVTKHAGMENVFDDVMNDELEALMVRDDVPYSGRVIYAGANGPRFETSAEVRMLRMLGAQVVGLTIVPEAPLAAEIGIAYASIGIISNYATGMAADLTEESIVEVVDAYKGRAFQIALKLICAHK
ncbi:MAG TPA: MTAP family purine nucleoside phosphorylase [Eubacteriales bacterium]|nr:MTAP family purine nucleoside phosphorylase [Clostridia bacterium]HRV73581.1 MTAP family purine nucleoside phosphorylase [Eubacteriales bacterium]